MLASRGRMGHCPPWRAGGPRVSAAQRMSATADAWQLGSRLKDKPPAETNGDGARAGTEAAARSGDGGEARAAKGKCRGPPKKKTEH